MTGFRPIFDDICSNFIGRNLLSITKLFFKEFGIRGPIKKPVLVGFRPIFDNICSNFKVRNDYTMISEFGKILDAMR